MPSIKNDADIRIEQLKQLDMKNMFGICDYYAIVLSRNEDRILVSSEIYTWTLGQILYFLLLNIIFRLDNK